MTPSRPDPAGGAPSAVSGPVLVPGYADSVPADSVDAAFATFCQERAPKLVAFLVSQGAPVQDARDYVQEALTRAYPRWAKINHPYSWCRTVIYRLYRGRADSLREVPLDGAEHAAAGSSLARLTSDPERRFAEWEAREEVLKHLPPRQREVLVWRLDGATPSETAAELGITPEAVRSSLRKARTTLRARLGAEGVDR